MVLISDVEYAEWSRVEMSVHVSLSPSLSPSLSHQGWSMSWRSDLPTVLHQWFLIRTHTVWLKIQACTCLILWEFIAHIKTMTSATQNEYTLTDITTQLEMCYMTNIEIPINIPRKYGSMDRKNMEFFKKKNNHLSPWIKGWYEHLLFQYSTKNLDVFLYNC